MFSAMATFETERSVQAVNLPGNCCSEPGLHCCAYPGAELCRLAAASHHTALGAGVYLWKRLNWLIC